MAFKDREMNIEEMMKQVPKPVYSELQSFSKKYGIDLTSMRAETEETLRAALAKGTATSVKNALIRVLAEHNPTAAIQQEISFYERRGYNISDAVKTETELRTKKIHETPAAALASYMDASIYLKKSVAGQDQKKRAVGEHTEVAETKPAEPVVATLPKQLTQIVQNVAEANKELKKWTRTLYVAVKELETMPEFSEFLTRKDATSKYNTSGVSLGERQEHEKVQLSYLIDFAREHFGNEPSVFSVCLENISKAKTRRDDALWTLGVKNRNILLRDFSYMGVKLIGSAPMEARTVNPVDLNANVSTINIYASPLYARLDKPPMEKKTLDADIRMFVEIAISNPGDIKKVFQNEAIRKEVLESCMAYVPEDKKTEFRRSFGL